MSVFGTLWLEFGQRWIHVLVEEFTSRSQENNQAETSEFLWKSKAVRAQTLLYRRCCCALLTRTSAWVTHRFLSSSWSLFLGPSHCGSWLCPGAVCTGACPRSRQLTRTVLVPTQCSIVFLASMNSETQIIKETVGQCWIPPRIDSMTRVTCCLMQNHKCFVSASFLINRLHTAHYWEVTSI